MRRVDRRWRPAPAAPGSGRSGSASWRGDTLTDTSVGSEAAGSARPRGQLLAGGLEHLQARAARSSPLDSAASMNSAGDRTDAVVVVHAQQRLGRHDLVGLDVDDRLVVDPQPVVVERARAAAGRWSGGGCRPRPARRRRARCDRRRPGLAWAMACSARPITSSGSSPGTASVMPTLRLSSTVRPSTSRGRADGRIGCGWPGAWPAVASVGPGTTTTKRVAAESGQGHRLPDRRPQAVGHPRSTVSPPSTPTSGVERLELVDVAHQATTGAGSPDARVQDAR